MAFRAIYPKEYLKSFLDKGTRIDGRNPGTVRPFVLGKDPMEKPVWASSVVRMGRTTISCGIGLEIGTPKPNAPQRGQFSVSVHLTPVCSPKFQAGVVPPEAVRIAQLLQSVVLSSQLLDLDSLGIREGQSVWVVSADLFCLDFDGNLADACVAALSLALPRLVFPSTAVDPKTGATVLVRPSADPKVDQRLLQALPISAGHREGFKLRVNHLLVSLSFGILEGRLIVDPTAEEEDQLDEDSRLTVVYTQAGQLAAVHKSGGTRFSLEEVRSCMKLAKQHVVQDLGPKLLKTLGGLL